MKTKVCTLILVLMLVFAFAAPTCAAEDTSAVSAFSCVPGEIPDQCVEDLAGILSETDREILNDTAIGSSSRYGCGIYVVIFDDYTAYTDGSVYDAATQWYSEHGYGLGEGDDGVMLALSMFDRDYSLICYGDSANYAFGEYAMNRLAEAFLDDFADDDWYSGIYDYILTAEEYIAMAVAGTPMNQENDPFAQSTNLLVILGICVLIPFLIALIVCLVFRAQMKPVKKQTAAKDYICGKVQYTDRSRAFSHVTETRTPLSKDNNGGFQSGGGFSGKSGKF